MRIGVNAFPLRVARGGALYAFAGLMRALPRLEPEHHYVIFTHPAAVAKLRHMLGTSPARIIPVRVEEQIHLHRDEFDLYFGPFNDLRPRVYDRPSVGMLMDIQQEYFPQYFSPAELAARRDAYLELCRAATTVVTISEFCKQTFIDKWKIPAAKIEVVPLAPQAEIIGDAAAWPGMPPTEPFFFYPANFYPHKNHAMLLEAIGKLQEPINLIFVGEEIPGGFPLRREIAKRGLSGRCRVYANLPPRQMAYLYRHAVATVMPTLFEGFGMPAIEAMACECPLVCSDIPPLREVAGENTIYFHPGNPEEFLNRLRQILFDPELRGRLISQGRRRAEQFTWVASARRMLHVFQKACHDFKSAGPAPRINLKGYTVEGESWDLVGMIHATDRLRPSALDSLAWSFAADPSRAVHLGEVCLWRNRKFVGVAHMRHTGDENWKLENGLYPAMLFIAPAALSRWPAGLEIVGQAAPDWQWRLIRAAMKDDQLVLLRRTLADCGHQRSLAGRREMNGYYRIRGGEPVHVPLLRRFERKARSLSQILPLPIQRAGAAIWYRLAAQVPRDL